MNSTHSPLSRSRKRFMAAAASIALAGAIGLGAVTTGTVPVSADPVHVDAPQVPSFADVVEQVSPAVVSVHVKAKIAACFRRWATARSSTSAASTTSPTIIR